MSIQSGTQANPPLPAEPSQPRLFGMPRTRLGWWAVGLLATFVVMFIINATVFVPAAQSTADAGWRQTLLPFYGIFMLLCGLAAGVVGLIAIIRRHERSWLIWLSVLPLLFSFFLLLGEFLGSPH